MRVLRYSESAPDHPFLLQEPRPVSHLSSERLDLLLLGSLSAADTNQAKLHLDACGACRERWRELNDDKQHFEQVVFPRTLLKVEARLAGPPGAVFERFRLWLVLPLAGLLSAAVVAGLIFTPLGGPTPSLRVFALRESEPSVEVHQGARLLPKTRLSLLVEPGLARFLLIGSRDASGAFTVQYPIGLVLSAPIDPQAQRPLEVPAVVALDDTLGPQALIAVFSSAPLNATEVEAALRHQPTGLDATVLKWDFETIAP